MKKIFTKRFFQLTPADQAAVVDAEIHGLELAVGATPEDQAAINRMIERIERRAVLYGILGPKEIIGLGRSEDQQHG